MSLIARFPLPVSLGGAATPSLAAWQWYFNGLTMGAGTQLGVLTAKGFDLASIRSGDMAMPRDQGELIGLDLYGGRDLELEVWMNGTGGLLANQLQIAKAVQLGSASESPLWVQLPGTTNYVSNPSFGYDTAGSAPAWWSAAVASGNLGGTAGATLTASTSSPFSGSQCMQVVSTSGSAHQGAWGLVSGLSVASGTAYTFSVYLRGNAGGELLTLRAGDNVNDFASTNVTLTTSWVRYSLTWTATNTDTNTGVSVLTNGSHAYTWFVDDAQFSVGASAITYEDGDQANGFYWTGTPGNSSSAPLLVAPMCRTRKRKMTWDATYAASARGEPTMSFHATDPRMYNPAQIVTMTLSSSGGGGLGFPVGPFPVTFGSSSSGVASGAVYNQGNTETRPILIFNGPVTSPYVTNQSVGSDYIQVSEPGQSGYTVQSGDQLVVDLGTPHRILYYAGGIASGVTPTPVMSWLVYGSSWWNLVPGLNTLRYGSADSSSTGIGSVQVVWSSAWQL